MAGLPRRMPGNACTSSASAISAISNRVVPTVTIPASATAGTSIPTTRAGTRPSVGGAANCSRISSSDDDARLVSQ